MKDNASRLPLIIKILILMQVFLRLNALCAGIAFLIAPDGHLIQMPLSNLKDTPFSDFLIPGILLFTFIGIFPTTVAYSLWRRPSWHWPDVINPFKGFHWSWSASLAAGAILIIWITVQIQWLQVGFLHAFCLGWGALLMLIIMLPLVRKYYLRNP